MADRTPLDLQTIRQQLDRWLEVEFSGLQTDQPAQVIATFDRDQQESLLIWTRRVASANLQLAQHFLVHAVAEHVDLHPVVLEAWALQIMDTYDQLGLHRALDVIRDLKTFVATQDAQRSAAVFERQAGVLSHFARGLSGRPLKLQQGDVACTDTETIFLPAVISHLPAAQDNFLIYKCQIACLWAQVRFGTFRADLQLQMNACTRAEHFIRLFGAFEMTRLESCIERELPGLYRTLQQLHAQLGDHVDAAWRELCRELREPDARVDDALRLTWQSLDKIDSPPRSLLHGELYPERANEVMHRRMAVEKARLRNLLRQGADAGQYLTDLLQASADSHFIGNHETYEAVTPQLSRQKQPLADTVRELANSIVQDIGYIPDDYLVPAESGDDAATGLKDAMVTCGETGEDPEPEQGTYFYSEWDFRRQHYRKNWCAVREISMTPVYDDFYAQTLSRYSGLVRQLRKTFEAMRDADRLMRRQANGDDVDIDALVEAFADSLDGSEMSEQLFTRLQRAERNIAVVFMIDMSGSTRGWINQAERESLILLAEALETLGDRYAIYGFSGIARQACEIYRIKEFADAYDDEVRARISGIRPRDYTRMGFAIRHLTQILKQVEARNRVLITISDGKPDDYDNYRGEYGIEDTRRALLEARDEGIHPYCITIDRQARDYLPHLYGRASYSVIDEVRQLPYKIPEIYRRLTS